jgi:hypothetical protein
MNRAQNLRGEGGVAVFLKPPDPPATAGSASRAQRAFHDPQRVLPAASGFDPHLDVMAECRPEVLDLGGERLGTGPA